MHNVSNTFPIFWGFRILVSFNLPMVKHVSWTNSYKCCNVDKMSSLVYHENEWIQITVLTLSLTIGQ